MLPPNSDDLTLMTDPVTTWALSCLAVAAGAGLVLTLGVIWPL